MAHQVYPGGPYDPSLPTQMSLPPPAGPANNVSPYEDQENLAHIDFTLLNPGTRVLKGPQPQSKQSKGYEFHLKVLQQPGRARMCGFGDKDRRPISAPPIVQLLIYDLATKNYVDYFKIETPTRYMCTVDIHNAQTNQPNNLLTSQATSPTISSATTAAFPVHSEPFPGFNASAYGNGYGNSNMQHQHSANGNSYPSNYPHRANGHPNGSSSHIPGVSREGSVARNLLGAVSASALKLEGLDSALGLFFVFPDLSVRTEGLFRLKFRVFDLMSSLGLFDAQGNNGAEAQAPCLALVHSAPFQVFSAKKFVGVPTSTPLSRKFAEQGVKISIRKEGTGAVTGKRKHNETGDRPTESSDED